MQAGDSSFKKKGSAETTAKQQETAEQKNV